MKRWIIAPLFLAAASSVFCEARNSRLVEPILPVSLRLVTELGFLTPVQGPVSLSAEGRVLVDRAVFWNWMSIGGFGASTLGLIITNMVDRTVGGMLSLVSVGFWTVSNLATAFTHRSISNEITLGGSDAHRPVTAGVFSLAGGVLGAATITALSLAFSDTTGAAEIAAYAGFGLSVLAGGFGVFKTFEYAAAAGADLQFF